MRIILASQSPRRRELLERMGILNFEIIPARGRRSWTPPSRRSGWWRSSPARRRRRWLPVRCRRTW
ncbi:MAG: Maf family protein [Lawsonibacter sp.]